MTFDFSISLFVYRYLPPPLRRPLLRAWLSVLLYPLTAVQQAFADTRVRLTRQVRYNGQTIVLERCLNLDIYGLWLSDVGYQPSNPIYIQTTNLVLSVLYTYLGVGEEEPSELFVDSWALAGSNPPEPPVLYGSSEVASGGAHFLVYHPATLTPDDIQRLEYNLNKYRIASKTYLRIPY
jgi:hypothetical protein